MAWENDGGIDGKGGLSDSVSDIFFVGSPKLRHRRFRECANEPIPHEDHERIWPFQQHDRIARS